MRNFPHLRDIAYYDIEKTLFWTLHFNFLEERLSCSMTKND